MFRRLRWLGPCGFALGRFSSLEVQRRPPHFRDKDSPYYISEEYWNKLSPSPREVLASKWFNNALWNTAREVSFSAPSQMKGGSTELNFGKAWLTPLDEAEVVPLLTKPRQLRDHPKSSRFLGGTVFWDSKVSEAVTTRCKFIKDTAFPVELQLVGHGVTPPDTTLWGHLKYNGRLAIVRGVSGSGKTLALLHHPPVANIVTFYFHADSLLGLHDAAGQPFSRHFAVRALSTDQKTKRDEAAASAVVAGVRSLLDGIGCSPGDDVRALIAIDEAGEYPEFVRAVCSGSGLIEKALNAELDVPIFIALAGTGIDRSVLPGSDHNRPLTLEPITKVWSGLCRLEPALRCLLPPDAKTCSHQLTNDFVSNARAAWSLATVAIGRYSLLMNDAKAMTTAALPDLCTDAARLLRATSALKDVSERSLPYLFVHAAFLQCQVTPLIDSDSSLITKYGVMRDTAQVFEQTSFLPNHAGGRELTPDEARGLVRPGHKAYVEEELRRFEMPATFTAWLHFSLGFGLLSPAGDGLEELTAQFAALALMARTESYFTAAYWSVVEKRCRARGMEAPWKVPFHLFELLSQLPGRAPLAAVEIARLKTRFDPTTVAANSDKKQSAAAALNAAVKAALTDTLSPTPPDNIPESHKVVINGPSSEFADVLVFPKGSQTLCLIQCKGSDKVNTATGNHFGLRDLFTELYKMGCDDDMSCLAGCLNAAQTQRFSAEWKDFHGVDEFAVAACIEAGEYDVAFALGAQIAAEGALLAQCTPAECQELQRRINSRNAADAALLKKLRTAEPTKWIQKEEVSSVGHFRNSAPSQSDNASAFDVLKSGLEAQTAALKAHCDWQGTAAAPLTRALNAVVNSCEAMSADAKSTRAGSARLADTLLRRTRVRRKPLSPFWRSTNPSTVLLEALLRTAKRNDVERVVLVWGRPVDAVPAWCVPPGCTLVKAGPWDGKSWPPTNLYPLVKPTAQDQGSTKKTVAGEVMLVTLR